MKELFTTKDMSKGILDVVSRVKFSKKYGAKLDKEIRSLYIPSLCAKQTHKQQRNIKNAYRIQIVWREICRILPRNGWTNLDMERLHAAYSSCIPTGLPCSVPITLDRLDLMGNLPEAPAGATICQAAPKYFFSMFPYSDDCEIVVESKPVSYRKNHIGLDVGYLFATLFYEMFGTDYEDNHMDYVYFLEVFFGRLDTKSIFGHNVIVDVQSDGELFLGLTFTFPSKTKTTSERLCNAMYLIFNKAKYYAAEQNMYDLVLDKGLSDCKSGDGHIVPSFWDDVPVGYVEKVETFCKKEMDINDVPF